MGSNPRIPTNRSFKNLTAAVILPILRFTQIFIKYNHRWGGMLCQCTGLNQEELLTYHLEFDANDFRFKENGRMWRLFFNFIGLLEVFFDKHAEHLLRKS